MRLHRPLIPALLLMPGLIAATARGGDPVPAAIESSLATHEDQIRQFAYDGDEATCFASEKGPSADDHFTVVFEKPVALKSVTARTGKEDGSGKVAGELQVSADGKTFEKLATFEDGKAAGGPASGAIRYLRIRPAASEKPIAIRELTIDSEPPVPIFRYPVEFVLDSADAPELKGWLEETAKACEKAYPMINRELASEGFQPPHRIWMRLSKKYRGVAATSGDRIVGAVAYFEKHRDDVGAMIHETVHVVQAYHGGDNPGWLVEGVADYVRFFKYEPGKLGRINARTAHYDNSYRVSAAFLDYLVNRYDREIVQKLNAAMRSGKYDDNLVHTLTGKFLGELDDEWRERLAPEREPAAKSR